MHGRVRGMGGAAGQVLMLSIFLIVGDGVSARHCLCVCVSLCLSLFLSLSLLLIAPEDSTFGLQPINLYVGILLLSSSDLLSHLIFHCPQFSLRVFVYIHALCLTPILHHQASHKLCSHFALKFSCNLSFPGSSGPRSSVRMVLLRILVLGAALGDVWLCSRDRAEQAYAGCAINCAGFVTTYRDGVKPYWLHIAYHGELNFISWQDRVLGAMRMVLETLLRGEDVVVHCEHGSQMEN